MDPRVQRRFEGSATPAEVTQEMTRPDEGQDVDLVDPEAVGAELEDTDQERQPDDAGDREREPPAIPR